MKLVIIIFSLLAIPIGAVILYVNSIKKLDDTSDKRIFSIDIGIVIGITVFLFLYFLSMLFLGYSGLHAIGGVLVFILFPILMISISLRNRKKIKVSNTHRNLFYISVGYVLLILIPIAISLIVYGIKAIN
jgi:hypothetical protein